ncbi:hypothetical protein BDD12DRAFT_781852 [Trichophaea hybrida]|nr:hypothetical protein BDD12DRAFT_781852 [Trichophaea hybrida]
METLTSTRQPDIDFLPDISKYKARTEWRLKNEVLPKKLPEGFPTKLVSPLVWKGSELKSDEWVSTLTAADHEEIVDAMAHFKGLGLPFGQICQKSFPLKSLGRKLRDLSAEIHNGRGFVVVRNFPVDKFDRADCILAYAGISSYIASLRGFSDRSGAVLVHITDISTKENVGTPAYTNDKQGFHTDISDIVSLLALGVAEKGGSSKLASGYQVYNVLAETRPDLIKTMSEDWPCDNFGGEPLYYLRPIMYFTSEQRLIMQFFRRSYTGFGSLPRPANIPPITEAQAEALDALHFMSEENSISMDLQKGDIQYINNLSIFHARDAYIDSEENKRYLLRLWLRDQENGWMIPEKLRKGPGKTWDNIRHEATSDNHRFPLNPEVKLE